MKKLFIIATLALCLTALVGTAAVGSGGANSAGVGAAKDTFVYQMSPGDAASDYSNLDAAMPADYDVMFMINMGPGSGRWTMEIVDCCIMGDTMLAIKLGQGGTGWGWATSPATIVLGPVSMPQFGWALVITGYLQCPGGFPAGYDWYIGM